MDYVGTKAKVKFSGDCLKQEKITFNHGKIVNIDEVGRNVIIFGVDMSSSPHIDNKIKDILIVGKWPTQGLGHTLAAEKLHPINFTKENTKFCLSLHYIGANSYLFVNGR